MNKIENRITFKIKKYIYYLKLLTPLTMKLLRSTKSKIPIKDENAESVHNLEIAEVVLVCCNVVKNDYQHDSRVLYTFAPNTSFGQLLDISSKNFIFLRTCNSEFSCIGVWCTDQNSNPLETEEKINATSVIN